MKKLLFILFFIVNLSWDSFTQTDKQLKILSHFEDSLIHLRKGVLLAKSDKIRQEQNTLFITVFKKILSQDMSYNHPFDSIPSLGILNASDGKFRMITWNIPNNDNTHTYYNLLQVKDRKGADYQLYDLHDASEVLTRVNNKTLKSENWYGALYYEIIEVKYKKKTYYTLLGWDGNNDITAKKIIDVLYFTSSNLPRFGAPVFKYPRKTVKRVFFEFATDASVSLKYEKKRKQIVFDHLSPIKEDLKGIPQYYVPDLSFDAFELEKGKWEFTPDIDIRIKSNKNFNDPRKLEKLSKSKGKAK